MIRARLLAASLYTRQGNTLTFMATGGDEVFGYVLGPGSVSAAD
jgi:hypothetical protein